MLDYTSIWSYRTDSVNDRLTVQRVLTGKEGQEEGWEWKRMQLAPRVRGSTGEGSVSRGRGVILPLM